jgi:hypothetical protein
MELSKASMPPTLPGGYRFGHNPEDRVVGIIQPFHEFRPLKPNPGQDFV